MPSPKSSKRSTLKLTPKQLRVLKLIRDTRRQRGVSPTMQEIADEVGVSRVTVFEHVEALIAKGALIREANKARSLLIAPDLLLPEDEDVPPRELHEERASKLVFPLAGKVAAGHPIEKFEQSDSIALEDLFGPRVGGARGKTFALEVDGMSMRDEGILDGDYVLVEQRHTARNGERVVALLPNGETTLKTFFKEKDGRIRLQPANPDFAPILVDDCQVQG
ncbi:MAG: LexA repressor, partial [Planctomycetota bacterium]